MPTSPKLQHCLKLLRFKDWSVQSGVFLLGAFLADDLLKYPWGFIAASLLLSSLCLAYGYALNEFFDDLQEKLADDPKTATQFHVLIYFFLAGALIVSWWISFTSFVVMALIGVTVWLHSSPPLRLKRQLFWRLFLNSLGFGFFFLLGASLDNHASVGEMLMAVYIFGLYLPLELIHVLAHMDADRAKGLSTFALAHGQKKTIILAIVCLAALILYSGLLCQMRFISLALAVWSSVHLLMLSLALMLFYQRENSVETYAKLRFRTKIVSAFYGAGMLAILVAKI